MIKNKSKLILKMSSLLLAAFIFLNLSVSVQAYAQPENTISYTAYSEEDKLGISRYYYIIDEYGNKQVVYCYNEDLATPAVEGTSGYIKYDYFSPEIPARTTETKSEVAAILYAGYPNEALGFMNEFNLSDNTARLLTQQAIWALTNGEDHTYDNIKKDNYLHALYIYAEKEKGGYGNTGTVDIAPEITLNEVNGVWKSDAFTINGDYTGEILLEGLPENVLIYNATTNAPVSSTLKVGDTVYIVYDGIVANSFNATINYQYTTSNIAFYKAPDKTHQNLIGFEDKVNNGSINIKATNLPPELPIKTASLTINKLDEDTNDSLSGAVLQLYEGDSTNGILIDEWVTTNEPKQIQVGIGKTYTLVEKSAPEGYEVAEPITFTIKNDEANNENVVITGLEDTSDYAAYRYDNQKYITNGQTASVVYCMNHNLANPEANINGTIPSLEDSIYPHYNRFILSAVNEDKLTEHQTVSFSREQLAELLLAGYPTDYYGYKKAYKLSDSAAYSSTQAALDAVLAGDTSLKATEGLEGEYLNLANYYNQLIKAYLNPQIAGATSAIDFYSWIDDTGIQGKTYQNLVGVNAFENNITVEVTMKNVKEEIEEVVPDKP